MLYAVLLQLQLAIAKVNVFFSRDPNYNNIHFFILLLIRRVTRFYLLSYSLTTSTTTA